MLLAPATNETTPGIVVGLSHDDLEHLRQGRFLGRRMEALGVIVWVCAAETDEAIEDALRKGTLLNAAGRP